MAGKSRLDALLVGRGLAPDRDQAMRRIMAGQVRVDGQRIFKPDATFLDTVSIEVESGPQYVSRGGEKLAAALSAFQIDVSGKVCADVGASTGGFTDCMLQRGAAQVYAIDVGSGLLDWKLRQNPKVVVMENTNARQIERLPSPVQVVTIDVSFISLRILLPSIRDWFASADAEPAILPVDENRPAHTVLALIKPQYEARRSQADQGKGVIRDPRIHRQVLQEVLSAALELGFQVNGLMSSPLLGPKGNREFLVWLAWPGKKTSDLEPMIRAAAG